MRPPTWTRPIWQPMTMPARISNGETTTSGLFRRSAGAALARRALAGRTTNPNEPGGVMAQRDAQKSEVQETTDDATTSPANRTADRMNISGAQPGAEAGAAGLPKPPSSNPALPPASDFERGATDRDIELTAEPPGT